ncbi:uncharacterized protein LOC134262567 [Saccostrea cucullata]|uniref:uncharacterized protein LOC134262567 n=1 Tax=Saccostrea cuccullata TaxID=36930 RepID=UPI002ED5783C
MASIIFRRRRRRLNRAVLRRPRVFRDLSNPLESLEEEEIFQRYRFSPTSILFIVNGVHDHLQRDTARNRPIPPLIQVLLFLRFVATGAHLRLIGDSLNVSECTTGRVVKAVARAIITVFMNLIKFPSGELATKVKEGFRRVAGKPYNQL